MDGVRWTDRRSGVFFCDCGHSAGLFVDAERCDQRGRWLLLPRQLTLPSA